MPRRQLAGPQGAASARAAARGAARPPAEPGQTSLQMLPPSGERPTFYTNNTQVRLSLVDAVLDLGIVESVQSGKVTVRQTARVIMAIPHAKRLAQALSRQLQDYEAQHGAIPVAEGPAAPRLAAQAE